jgi:PAS domain S-box-containing protein
MLCGKHVKHKEEQMCKPRILIAEDERIVADDIKSALERFGYAISSITSTGEETIKKAQEEKTNLVLMDIIIGGKIDGIEVARRIREQLNIPVVFLIAYTYESTLKRAKITEPYAYVVKPLAERELYAAIEMVLSKYEVEKTLQESERFSSSLCHYAPNPIIVINPDTSVRYVNPALERLTGYSSSDLIGVKAPYPWWTEETLRKTKRDLKMAMSKDALKLEEIFQTKTGTQFWVEITSVPVKEGGELKYYLANWVEITQRKCAEKALQESEERFKELVENSPVSILIMKNGRMIYQNPEYKRLIGDLTKSSQFPKLECIHPEDVEKVKVFYQKILSEKNGNLDINFRFYPSGKKRSTDNMKWVQCQARLAQYYGETSILFNAFDITKTKELERIVMMQDKMTSLGCVAAGIVHEIKNPLTGINTYLYTLEEACNSHTLRQEDLEMTRQIVGQLKTASNKIESVIRRVMDFSRPNSLETVLVDINQCFQEAINLSSISLRKARIEIEQSLAQGLPKCYANPNLIEQAILNLINNAAKAMEDTRGTKKIKLTSSQKNGSIVMGVSDSGPGVPFEIRDRIFDPFFSRNASMGIGLSIVQRIIADHGGYIYADTSELGGAEFKIELPIEKKE